MSKNDTGWGGVFSIYPKRKFFKGCIIPALLLVISAILFSISKDAAPVSLLQLISGYVISGYPSVIGFVLTGYALIIGFSGSELVGKMAKIKIDNKYSYFQMVSSIFAVVLLIVVATYIIACFISYIIALNINWPYQFISSKTFNTGSFFAFLFLFYYSLCSLIAIIVNIFNIGQYANAVAQNKQVKETENLNYIEKVLRFFFNF